MFTRVCVHVRMGASIKHRWQMVITVFPGILRVKEMFYRQPLQFYKLVCAAHGSTVITAVNSSSSDNSLRWDTPSAISSEVDTLTLLYRNQFQDEFWPIRIQEHFVDRAPCQPLQNYNVFIKKKKKSRKSPTEPQKLTALGITFQQKSRP